MREVSTRNRSGYDDGPRCMGSLSQWSLYFRVEYNPRQCTSVSHRGKILPNKEGRKCLQALFPVR